MFDPQSLCLCIDSIAGMLGLTTLVAAFFNSSKRGPMHGTVASLWGTPSQGSPVTS